MKLSWDENKRLQVLDARGLDFSQAAELFESFNFTDPDLRFDYGETRFVSTGYISERLCVVVWTARDEDTRHIISLRKANDREQARFKKRMG